MACSLQASKLSPCKTTFAPYFKVPSTFIIGVCSGIQIVASIPNLFAEYATPWAWLPAEAVIIPTSLEASSSFDNLL